MLSTEAFYEAFQASGFLFTATWTPLAGGPQQSAPVRFRAPSREVLSGDQFSVDYTIRYPATKLVGLKRGETVSIAGASGVGVDYVVQKDPESRLDGSELEAQLSKV